MVAENPAAPRRVRHTRFRALTAAGAILGLGVSVGVTRASWVDPEFASETFTASTFAVEESANGSAYSDAPAPGILVALPSSPGFTPGSTSYFPVLVRAKAGSLAGQLLLEGADLNDADTGLGSALVYKVVRTTATCNAAAFSATATYVVGSATTARDLTSGQEAGVSLPLPAGASAAPGAVVGLCFSITLPTSASSAVQGKKLSATWRLVATSS